MSFLMPLLLPWAAPVLAQQAVYRCGQEYTNAPQDIGRCERLTQQAVTVVPGTRVQAPAAMPADSPARAATGHQRQRDDMGRAIVVAELDKAREKHAALQLEVAKAQGPADEAALKAALARTQRDIDSLQRELERRPSASAPP